MKEIREILIFYFSGTGNARQIALWFSEFALKKRIDCHLINIEKTDAKTLKAFDPETLIMIISPIHGFNFPKITLNFIEHFPNGKNNIVLMNTRAGMRIGRFVTPGLTGISFILSSFILKRKAYHISGQIPFDMPSNWLSIHPALGKRTVEYLNQKNYRRVEKHSDKIFSGKRDFHAYRDLVQDILIAPVSLAYYLFGRFAFAKSFYASQSCNSCGFCVKECPVKAINMKDNHPFWTFQCESCMKCMNSCPKKAIETAHGLFVVILLLSSVIIDLLLNRLSFINSQSFFIKITLFTLVFFVLLWILYKVQHLLLRNKVIAKLISLTSMTHYRFWGRYQSIPDKEWKGK